MIIKIKTNENFLSLNNPVSVDRNGYAIHYSSINNNGIYLGKVIDIDKYDPLLVSVELNHLTEIAIKNVSYNKSKKKEFNRFKFMLSQQEDKFSFINEDIQTCTKCNLHGKNWTIPRGNYNSSILIIGEAPGKLEAELHTPFIGPAGQLLSEIMNGIDINLLEDVLITNTIMCRPIAPQGSNKQNLPPSIEQKEACKDYLNRLITLMKPEIIIPMGKHAIECILQESNIRVFTYKGRVIKKILNNKETIIFPMLHPSYILHNKKDPAKYQKAKEDMWEDALKLKEIRKALND